MEQFVYPAVFYFNEEYNVYAVAFPDVNIYTEGETMEIAYQNAQKYLYNYIHCCKQLNFPPEIPSDFNKIVEENKNGTVMLVSIDLGKKDKEKNSQEPVNVEDNLFEDFDLGVSNFQENDIEITNETINENYDDDDDDYSLPEIE